MKELTKSNNTLARYKKWWLLGVAGVVLFFAAGIVGWSFYAWQDYAKQYTAWHDGLRQEAGKTFGLKVTTEEEKVKKLAQLEHLEEMARKGNGYCNAYGWLHWEQFIGDVKTRIEQCRQLVATTDNFSRDLLAVTEFLRGEAKIASVLREIPAAGEADESAWKTIANKWNDVRETLAKLTLPKNMKDTQKIAGEKAASIHSAWLALIAASEAKDRQKYEAAADQIDTVYSGLDQIIQTSQKTLQPLADTLDNSYRRAFLKA